MGKKKHRKAKKKSLQNNISDIQNEFSFTPPRPVLNIRKKVRKVLHFSLLAIIVGSAIGFSVYYTFEDQINQVTPFTYQSGTFEYPQTTSIVFHTDYSANFFQSFEGDITLYNETHKLSFTFASQIAEIETAWSNGTITAAIAMFEAVYPRIHGILTITHKRSVITTRELSVSVNCSINASVSPSWSFTYYDDVPIMLGITTYLSLKYSQWEYSIPDNVSIFYDIYYYLSIDYGLYPQGFYHVLSLNGSFHYSNTLIVSQSFKNHTGSWLDVVYYEIIDYDAYLHGSSTLIAEPMLSFRNIRVVFASGWEIEYCEKTVLIETYNIP